MRRRRFKSFRGRARKRARKLIRRTKRRSKRTNSYRMARGGIRL
mgnify:CR=1 FL=1